MRRRAHDEHGSVLILMAIGIVAMVLMVAIVIDLGSTRATRSKARAAADAAASAGALDLGNVSLSAAKACQAAFSYAFSNLGATQPTGIATACDNATNGGMTTTSACTAATSARVARLVVADRTVEVTNPVPDDHRLLLRATAVGGGVDRPFKADADGEMACGRIGVEITQPQSQFFAGVASSTPGTFRVHSVARYQADAGSTIPPALVVLNETACQSIDTGNGDVWVESTPAGPGIVHSDSDGTSPACTGNTGILHAGSSGTLRAAASASAPGELTWYLPPCAPPSTCPAPARGYTERGVPQEYGQTSTDGLPPYVGRLYGRAKRTTRRPADARYNCTRIPITAGAPLCTAADPRADPVKDAHTLSLLTAATAPSKGFAVRPDTECDSDGGAEILVDTFVNCDLFEVKDGRFAVKNGVTVIFKGRLEVKAGGTLAVNVSPGSPPTLVEDLPDAASSSAQSRLIVASEAATAIDISTNSSALYLAQTFIYNRGGLKLQSLNTFRWSPPSSGPTKGLLYWSETTSTEALAIQGGPDLRAAGIMFLGEGRLASTGGSGTINLTRVQVWADKLYINGGATIRLSPDPTDSIKTAGRPGTSLVR